jgi:hypothetical protein
MTTAPGPDMAAVIEALYQNEINRQLQPTAEQHWAITKLDRLEKAIEETLSYLDWVKDQEHVEGTRAYIDAARKLRRKVEVAKIKDGTFSCGHPNRGTDENPASVFDDCPTCGTFYCNQCNYDTHRCYGCGDDYQHGEEPHGGVSCVD